MIYFNFEHNVFAVKITFFNLIRIKNLLTFVFHKIIYFIQSNNFYGSNGDVIVLFSFIQLDHWLMKLYKSKHSCKKCTLSKENWKVHWSRYISANFISIKWQLHIYSSLFMLHCTHLCQKVYKSHLLELIVLCSISIKIFIKHWLLFFLWHYWNISMIRNCLTSTIIKEQIPPTNHNRRLKFKSRLRQLFLLDQWFANYFLWLHQVRFPYILIQYFWINNLLLIASFQELKTRRIKLYCI